MTTDQPQTVSREQWLIARSALLVEEKAHTKAREALAEKRRALPRVAVDKDYQLVGTQGRKNLSALFEGQSPPGLPSDVWPGLGQALYWLYRLGKCL